MRSGVELGSAVGMLISNYGTVRWTPKTPAAFVQQIMTYLPDGFGGSTLRITTLSR